MADSSRHRPTLPRFAVQLAVDDAIRTSGLARQQGRGSEARWTTEAVADQHRSLSISFQSQPRKQLEQALSRPPEVALARAGREPHARPPISASPTGLLKLVVRPGLE